MKSHESKEFVCGCYISKAYKLDVKMREAYVFSIYRNLRVTVGILVTSCNYVQNLPSK